MQNEFDLDDFILRALSEDIGDGDHTTLSTISADAKGKAKLLVKEKGILAGVSIAKRILELVDPALHFDQLLNDGDKINLGNIAFYVEGSSRSITTAERLLLNVMQRMSGIATKTNRIAMSISDTKCKLLDTRKTTPGFRHFEKLAVNIGGGVNHRFGLYDMIMVKDNHVDFCGGVKPALDAVKKYLSSTGRHLKVEVEARNIAEVEEILACDIAFRIMLDNFPPDHLIKAVAFINGRVETEASGGINEKNALQYAMCGVDYISMGALTHQIESLDLSLKAC